MASTTSSSANSVTKTSTHENNVASSGTAQAEEEVDIDLTDPEVEKAAMKIQGAFKGLKSKKATSGTNKSPATNPDKP